MTFSERLNVKLPRIRREQFIMMIHIEGYVPKINQSPFWFTLRVWKALLMNYPLSEYF